MRELRSYVVRIYRQGAHSLAGVVEDPRSGASRRFETAYELWNLLLAQRITGSGGSESNEPGGSAADAQ